MNAYEFPLSDLVLGDAINSRKTGRTAGLEALQASIKAHGLLQPLIITGGKIENNKEGKQRVIDGNRRLAALKAMQKAGDLPKDFMVAVRSIESVADDDGAALELSLAANIVRENMHLSDAVEAVAAMVDAGKEPHAIADHFDKPVEWVSRCIRLARELSPKIRKEWIAGTITTPQVEALTLAKDFETQEKVWKEAKGGYSQEPLHIRRMIAHTGVPLTDKRVLFVGLANYKDAGGFVRHDLFSDEGMIEDEALLDRMVAESLRVATDAYKADGWKFAATRGDPGFESNWFPQIDGDQWMTDEERTFVADFKNPWKDRDAIREEAHTRMINDLEARAQSGVVLSLKNDGSVLVDYCVIHPDDEAKENTDEDADQDAGEDDIRPRQASAEPEPEPRLPKAQLEGLSETLTVAVSRTLSANPDVALSLICATLAAARTSVVMLNRQPWSALRDASRGEATIADLLPVYQAKTVEQRLMELAALLAENIDLRDSTRDRNYLVGREGMEADANAIISALRGDALETAIKTTFAPEIHFARAPASECQMAAQEIGCLPAIKGLKKAAMAEVMAAEAKRSGWLPPELRTMDYAGPAGVVSQAKDGQS